MAAQIDSGNVQGSPTTPSASDSKARDYPMPQRDKYWDECDVEQKFDRIREVLLALNMDNTQFAESVANLLTHQHTDSGAIVTPLPPFGRAQNLGSYTSDRVYRLRTKREAER